MASRRREKLSVLYVNYLFAGTRKLTKYLDIGTLPFNQKKLFKNPRYLTKVYGLNAITKLDWITTINYVSIFKRSLFF